MFDKERVALVGMDEVHMHDLADPPCLWAPAFENRLSPGIVLGVRIIVKIGRFLSMHQLGVALKQSR